MLATLLLTIALAAPPSEPDTTFRLARGATVSIESGSRPIVLRTTTSSIATVRGASAELHDNDLSIEADEEFVRGRSGPIEVTVPVWASVDVNTANGSITIEGAPERVHVETMNGTIKSSGGTGRLEFETVAANVTITDFQGSAVRVEAAGGDITLRNVSGRIDIESVGGTIALRGIRSSRVSVSTTNGGIEYEGPLDPKGRYDFATHNGPMTFTLPGDVSARFEISTFNGVFESQIPARMPKRSEIELGDDFTATIGAGEARVVIESFNGAIRVLRAPTRR